MLPCRGDGSCGEDTPSDSKPTSLQRSAAGWGRVLQNEFCYKDGRWCAWVIKGRGNKVLQHRSRMRPGQISCVECGCLTSLDGRAHADKLIFRGVL